MKKKLLIIITGIFFFIIKNNYGQKQPDYFFFDTSSVSHIDAVQFAKMHDSLHTDTGYYNDSLVFNQVIYKMQQPTSLDSLELIKIFQLLREKGLLDTTNILH